MAGVNFEKTRREFRKNTPRILGKQETARRIDLAIGRNLSETLKRRYPRKAFVVYLDLSFSDSTIMRFHQLWPGEPPYYAPGDFPQIVGLR